MRGKVSDCGEVSRDEGLVLSAGADSQECGVSGGGSSTDLRHDSVSGVLETKNAPETKNAGFRLSPVFCIHNKVCIVEDCRGVSENSKKSAENSDENVTIGLCNVYDALLKKRIQHVFDISEPKGRKLKFVEVTEAFCRRAVARMLADTGCYKNAESQVGADERPDESGELMSAENAEVPAVNLIDSVIIEALTENASDIHFEPYTYADGTKKLVVRFRKDGGLVQYRSTDISLLEPVIVRIKMLAGLRVEESRRPQDGRFVWKNAGLSADIRVSVIPLWNGESAVLRLLRTTVAPVQLVELGFSDVHVRTMCKILSKRNSLVLVAGPTGAGKTTTLAGMVSYLASGGSTRREEKNVSDTAEAAPDSTKPASDSTEPAFVVAGGRRKIITIEDPVEYRIPGVTQIEVHPGIQFDFDDALRHVFRHDPDVLMIGEIRDGKTAATAVRAAVTGHLVLATVHASSACAAVIRLLDMGIEPYLLASVFGAAVAQCLVPAAAGGRTVVAEILCGTESVRSLIAKKAAVSALASCMHEQGMVSLREDFDAKKALGVIAETEAFYE